MTRSKIKRKGGRPPGSKDKQPRRRHERVAASPDAVWLSKREAAGRLGVSMSLIDRNLSAIGAVKMGDRVLIHRDRLDEWALSLPTATSITPRRSERESATA